MAHRGAVPTINVTADSMGDSPQAMSRTYDLDEPSTSYDPVRLLSGQGHGRGQRPGDLLTVNLTAVDSRHSIIASGVAKPKVTVVAPPEDNGDNASEVSLQDSKPSCRVTSLKYFKCALLLILWLLFTIILMMHHEKVNPMHQVSIPQDVTRTYWILERPVSQQLMLSLEGAFVPALYRNLSTRWLTVWLEALETTRHDEIQANLSSFTQGDVVWAQNLSQAWQIPLVSEELVDFVPDILLSAMMDLHNFDTEHPPRRLLRLQMRTNMAASLPLSLNYDVTPIKTRHGILYAAAVLLGLYVLIMCDVVHRTLAAILASTMSVAILAAFNERPTMTQLMSWIDVETLLLLFSMMVLVAVLSETGIFDYLAVFAYKITGGRIWPLVITLCVFTALMSSVLDNVTTILLMTPVTIRLCEVMELNPVPVLMFLIIYSNIGGAVTPVGDPPNVIIASNADVIAAGVDFATFTLHIGVGAVLVMAVTYVHLRLVYRRIEDLRFNEPHVQGIRHEIAIWQRAAASLSSYTKEEDAVIENLSNRVRRLLSELKSKIMNGDVVGDNYKANLEELQMKYPIKDKVLLAKCCVTLLFVVTLFFLHSIPGMNLSLGWSALLGAILLLLLADIEDMEGVLSRVEWSTLIFFAALFVLMECMTQLGLIDYIGQQTESFVSQVEEEYRLTVAILLVLWVSAFASAFIDNIPLTTVMVRIVTSLAKNPDLGLPLQPLVWALTFGACLGGNGTLIGASANVVCAGVAEQHGYRFTFMQYFRVGFPVMIVGNVAVTIYLLIVHVALTWHYY